MNLLNLKQYRGKNGKQLLGMATKGKDFTVKIDNKLRGAYGETDYEKGVIRINKKKHSDPKVKRLTPNPDGTENMLTTIHHELLHAKHPQMSEKQVETKARRDVKKMSTRQKAKIYAKVV